MITSTANSRIKAMLKLAKASERRKLGHFVVEGVRELQLALGHGYSPDVLYFCPELVPDGFSSRLGVPEDICMPVSRAVFDRIAYRENRDGIVGVLHTRPLLLSDIRLSEYPLVIVLEAVEKPGNLGAVLRTADAVQADAVVVCDPKTDFFNPNVVRSSIGCCFTRQVALCTNEELLAWLAVHGITTYAAALTADGLYHEADYQGAVAFLMGTEATGLSDFWLHHADHNIKIPMLGEIDSLNVSVSTAILVYEAKRQRGFQ